MKNREINAIALSTNIRAPMYGQACVGPWKADKNAAAITAVTKPANSCPKL